LGTYTFCDTWEYAKNEMKTAEHLTLASLGKSALESVKTEEAGDRSRSQFTEDESIPSLFRAKLKDYFRSGYDRGHMCVH
jgi:endonuclease G, mitochondrial